MKPIAANTPSSLRLSLCVCARVQVYSLYTRFTRIVYARLISVRHRNLWYVTAQRVGGGLGRADRPTDPLHQLAATRLESGSPLCAVSTDRTVAGGIGWLMDMWWDGFWMAAMWRCLCDGIRQRDVGGLAYDDYHHKRQSPLVVRFTGSPNNI